MKRVKFHVTGLRQRRVAAAERLMSQLSSGKKPSKEEPGFVELTEKDRTRIKSEIAVLTERVNM